MTESYVNIATLVLCVCYTVLLSVIIILIAAPSRRLLSDIISFSNGTVTFIILWDQLLYPCVVEVSYMGLEPMCDTHFVYRVLLQIFTVLIFIIYEFYE